MFDTIANVSIELSDTVYSKPFLQDQWDRLLDIIGKYLLLISTFDKNEKCNSDL